MGYDLLIDKCRDFLSFCNLDSLRGARGGSWININIADMRDYCVEVNMREKVLTILALVTLLVAIVIKQKMIQKERIENDQKTFSRE